MTTLPELATKTPDRALRADARRNRERVLQAARECMARAGIDAQVEEIARTACVGIGTVYRHFPTKDDLVEALATERFERLAELAQAALAQEDAGDAFEGFIRASGRIQSEDRALSEVLTSRPETMARAAASVDMLDLVAQVMQRAKLAGTLRNPYTNPERYIQIVLDGLRADGLKRAPLPPVAAT